MKTLILGGMRSGKSRLAESLAIDSGQPVIYIATAQAGDEEMRARIEQHRLSRPSTWAVVEEPLLLGDALRKFSAPGQCVLVDCLTLWITNLLCATDSTLLEKQTHLLLNELSRATGTVLLVSNETNMGIVPMDPLSRRFCDETGRLHQQIARICDRVVLAVAGLPLTIKGDPI